MEILLTLALLSPVVWLMERTHRRTRDLPRVPFGADAESESTTAYRRQLAELRELSQLLGDEGALSPVGRTGHVIVPAPAAGGRTDGSTRHAVSPLATLGLGGTAPTVKPC